MHLQIFFLLVNSEMHLRINFETHSEMHLQIKVFDKVNGAQQLNVYFASSHASHENNFHDNNYIN